MINNEINNLALSYLWCKYNHCQTIIKSHPINALSENEYIMSTQK